MDYWPWDNQVSRWTTGLGTTGYPGELLGLGLPGIQMLLALGLPSNQVEYLPWSTRYPGELLGLGLPGIQVDYWPRDYQVSRWTISLGLPGIQVNYWAWD